ncbi:MAG: glutathione S-transferase [Alphaproteobacteria bacterium]
MKFYDCETAPSPRRARIFMAEKGLDIPIQQVALRHDEQLTPAFQAINPWCTVPVLELDDGTRISEAIAVCSYLEAAYPEPPLMGVDAADKGIVMMWEHRFEQDGFFAAAEALRNRTPGLKGRAITGPANYPQIPELAERGSARLEHFFRRLDEALEGREFVAGPRYTIADITALVSVDFAGWLKLTIPDDCAHARRWYEAVSARPSAKA